MGSRTGSRTRRCVFACAQAALIVAAPAAMAQSPSAAPSAPVAAPTAAPTAEAPPERVRQLLDLLADPTVQAWIDARRLPSPAAPTPATAAPSAAPALPAMAQHVEDTLWTGIAARISFVRQHLEALVRAIPNVPADLAGAWAILQLELQQRGLLNVLLLVASFLALGIGAELLFWRATKSVRQWVIDSPLDTVGQRLRAIGVRFAFSLGVLAAFAFGSIGAFLIFDWPVLLKEIVLGYLTVFVIARLGMVLCRFLLAPGAERFRILPMPTVNAWFWYRRVPLAIAWFAFGWVTVDVLRTLNFPVIDRQLVAYALGLGLLAIGLEIAWRRPRAVPDAADHGLTVQRWLLSVYMVVLWGLWVARFPGLFGIAVIALVLPAAIAMTQRAVAHVLSPPGDSSVQAPTVTSVYVDRGVRAVLIIGAMLALAWAMGIDLIALSGRDTAITRVMRGLINAVLILLAADLAWGLFCAVVDRRLMRAQHDDDAIKAEETRQNARLRTLLPILRNIVLIALLVIAGLMVLSELGIEIGPLVAGAGVVGVAVGFGAQTLVKDIISGIFYLLDDAFRVGEYIQSGNYRGTVESFSLRSVKLRHHRGPLYTIPFGSLGAVQNMSRDWVIDKMTINVTYDTDLELVKKIVKQVGKTLADDPEFAPHILETLKMQGVEQFGDFAIGIRMKIMTKPGEQFVIRRRAYALLKKQFDANGIQFALPTVHVAGGAANGPAGEIAVAQAGLSLVSPPPPA